MNLKVTSGTTLINSFKIALYGLLLTGMYYSAATGMIRRWGRAEYNYCYLIPFVVFYLIREKRARLSALPSVPSWKGMIPFGFGLAFFWIGELGGEYFTLYISFWLVVVGLCWTHLGWQKIKTIAFALFMILTMFPLPNFLYNKISIKLQLISSKLGVSLMQFYGMSVHREGNLIDLGFAQLQVVDACSGLRSLISLTVLGLLMAYFFRASLWKRVILLVSTLPLSIFANSIRLALAGILSEIWGYEIIEGFFHGFSGWVIFGFAFAILLLEMWILAKISPFNTSSAPASTSEKEIREKISPRRKESVFIVAIILLGATMSFSHGINFREKIPIIKSFDQFPLHAGEWRGIRQNMEQRFIDALNFSDYAVIDYHNSSDESVNFYAAYYESQRKGESIHSPATCLSGSGWLFRDAGDITFSTPGFNGGFMRVNRAHIEKLGSRQLCYYWFPQRGRILTNAYQLKFFVFWDAITRQRTDGALVRLITPVAEFEELEQADARLQGFIRLIAPVLEIYISGDDA